MGRVLGGWVIIVIGVGVIVVFGVEAFEEVGGEVGFGDDPFQFLGLGELFVFFVGPGFVGVD